MSGPIKVWGAPEGWDAFLLAQRRREFAGPIIHVTRDDSRMARLAEALHEEIQRLPAMFDAPQLINIVIGGKTPTLPQSRLAELGFGIALYANAPLQSAVRGMQRALSVLKAQGRLDEDPGNHEAKSLRQSTIRRRRGRPRKRLGVVALAGLVVCESYS